MTQLWCRSDSQSIVFVEIKVPGRGDHISICLLMCTMLFLSLKSMYILYNNYFSVQIPVIVNIFLHNTYKYILINMNKI